MQDKIIEFSKKLNINHRDDLKNIDKEELVKHLTPAITDFVNKLDTTKVKGFLDFVRNFKGDINKLESLEKRVTTIEETGDRKTKKKLNQVLNNPFIGLDDFETKIKELEKDLKYCVINQNKESNTIMNSLGTFNRNESSCIVDIYGNTGTIKLNGLVYTIENYDRIKHNIKVSTSKLFVYAIMMMDFKTGKSNFNFTDYANFIGVSIQTKNRETLKKDLDVLKKMSNIKYKSPNRNFIIWETLIISGIYDNGNVSMQFGEEFTQNLKDTFMYFPKSLMKSKNNNIFLLGWYIFKLLRLGRTKVSIKSCLKELDIIKHDEVKNWEYKKLIIEPFDNLISEISETIDHLEINYESGECPENINDFLEENIVINFTDKNITTLYDGNEKKKREKLTKVNKNKRDDNILLCERYKKDGKTPKEISIIMNKSERTIKRYFDMLDKSSKKPMDKINGQNY